MIPDWVCEVISPSTAARDRVTKRALYARAGIAHYWLIDPDARVLEALALRDGVWVEVGVYDERTTARIAPFEAIEVAIGEISAERSRRRSSSRLIRDHRLPRRTGGSARSPRSGGGRRGGRRRRVRVESAARGRRRRRPAGSVRGSPRAHRGAPGAGGIGDAGSGGDAVLELRVVRRSVARDQERVRTVHEVGDVRGRVARGGQRPERAVSEQVERSLEGRAPRRPRRLSVRRARPAR